MAPKVKVPMDFGRHLLGSPTHNNLTLNTKEGGKVRASSVILSFNSQVIDHMTSTLHMTSVDMLEFSEAAVQVFVDAAYSGTVEGLTKEVFRDVNKIANVFDVSWLFGKCSEFFIEVVNSVKTPTYTELLYLFEEASFVYENLKRKEYIKVTINKIETLRWKEEFIEKYLENVEGVSTGKLDMVIELAGSEVNCVVETLTKQLTELIKIPDSQLPLSCKYLLDNLDLFLLKESNTQLFDRLFSVLGGLSDEHMRWTFNLLQKSCKSLRPVTNATAQLSGTIASSTALPAPNILSKPTWTEIINTVSASPASSISMSSRSSVSSTYSPSDDDDDEESVLSVPRIPNSPPPLDLNLASSVEASSITASSCATVDRCDIVPNLYHELDLNMTIHGLLDYLAVSEKVTSLLMALEVLLTWDHFGKFNGSTVHCSIVNAALKYIVQKRSWSFLPPDFKRCCFDLPKVGHIEVSSMILSSKQDHRKRFFVLTCEEERDDHMLHPCDLQSEDFQLKFHFCPPSVKFCTLEGSCGFILKSVESEETFQGLRLCTEKEDYRGESIHFHDEIRAEKMHVYFNGKVGWGEDGEWRIFPLSWLMSNQDAVLHYIKNMGGYFESHYGVLYEI